MRVSVCVITYRRPQGLERLLRSLDAQAFQSDPPDLEIVVVENEVGGTAATLCGELRETIRWPLRCVSEPRRGIPFARNKAVSCAMHGSDFVAFIDDDEEAEPDWLDELLRVQQQTGADIVTGPVVPHFPKPPAKWVVRGRFFETPRVPTGTPMDVAYTNNVLARSKVYRSMNGHFSEVFAFTGGSDTEFFRRARRAGHSIVWADSALVREWIPDTRIRVSWLLRRAFRKGGTLTLARLVHAPRWGMRILVAGKGVVWMLLGLSSLPVRLASGRASLVKGLQWMAFGAGTLAALRGKHYEAYRTTNGT